ncbi:MAG TPA: PAS domain S-box protein [Microvirga sp.]|jgi:PAS domain S-box-containing protein|nr:PAS domain S-box protein [Microvirga sp.]
MTYPLPRNEVARLNALHGLHILDTPREEHFDAVARLAQQAFDVPVALVSLLDADRQWFKASCGVDLENTPREVAFCAYAVLSDEVLVVEDATRDARFASNPLVTGEPGVRFYAGAPLALESGLCVGTLCIVDFAPRSFSSVQAHMLQDLARTVVAHLRLHEAKAAIAARELRLQEQSGLLEATLEHMDQGLIMIDGDDRVRVCNKRAVELLDLPAAVMREPCSYRDIREYQFARNEFERSGDEFRHWLKTASFGDKPFQYERERPNGTAIEVRSLPLPDGGAVRTFTDVTARRKVETELRRSEELYRALVAASASIVWRSDPAGAITDGIGWEDFSGQFAESYRGHGWLAAIHPDDQPSAVATWQAVLESGLPGTNEFRVRRANGVYHWVSCRAVPLHNEDGTIREWVGTLSDIHDQKLAQEELAQSEARYRLLAENATDMIARTRLDGTRLYLSPAARDLLGYEAEELLGSHLAEITHPDDTAIAIDSIAELLARPHQQQTITYRLRHKDGHWVTLESRRRLVLDAEGKPVEFVSVARDVTERLHLEDQLRQAQKMQAVGQLTGGIAHDFNNLLTVILGNAEILTENPADPALTHALAAQILETAERGADLNQKLLAFGRRQSLKPEPLKVERVIDEMVPLLYRTISEHIELNTDLHATDAAVSLDRTLLESAILNLVVNARDSMPRGGTVTIRTGKRRAMPGEGPLKAGQPVVFIAVSDTGTGMAPDVLERAFEPFFTTKEVGKGSGLGLSMVHGFAQQSAGHVAIESTLGRGTTVTMVLPALPTQGNEARPGPDAPAVAPTARGRILLSCWSKTSRRFCGSSRLSSRALASRSPARRTAPMLSRFCARTARVSTCSFRTWCCPRV